MSDSVDTALEKRMTVFLEQLLKEYNRYEQMITCCQTERQFIKDRDWQQLRASLGKKNALLDEVVHIDEETTSLKEEWNQKRESLSPSLREQLQELLERFKRLIEQLMTEQRQNETLLQQQNVQRTQELEMVRKGKNLSKAYSVSGKTGPRSRYMDKRK